MSVVGSASAVAISAWVLLRITALLYDAPAWIEVPPRLIHGIAPLLWTYGGALNFWNSARSSPSRVSSLPHWPLVCLFVEVS